MGLFDGFAGKERSFSDLRKYVDDFEVTEEKDARGRTRKTARYKGQWTILRDTSAAGLSRIWITAGLAALVLAAYIRMLLLTHLAGSELLVMLPLLAGLFPALYLAMGAVSLPFRGKPMRRDQYMHGFIRVFRSCAAVSVFMLIGQLAALIFRAVRGDWLYMREDWLFTGLGCFILITALGIIGLLRSVDVTERPNGFYREGKSK
ncbi:MAG: hypothetical protein IJJ42_09600 [Clostridia bacterium]|nr:hypothetical protein [Clostridia bacterium]